MKTQIHREITIMALSRFFAADALETVILANLGQDALKYQIGHDHFHYDNNSFAAGDAYCDEMARSAVTALRRSEARPARVFLGRLSHTVQDLYAHSNYVALWRESHPGGTPDAIHPQLSDLLKDPHLHSGRLYYPLEVLSFIAAFKSFVLPMLPRDSHAWMNIDDPSRPDFEFAFSAAVKRTQMEFERVAALLTNDEIVLLTGNKEFAFDLPR